MLFGYFFNKSPVKFLSTKRYFHKAENLNLKKIKFNYFKNLKIIHHSVVTER
jgi:hypothetical protein